MTTFYILATLVAGVVVAYVAFLRREWFRIGVRTLNDLGVTAWVTDEALVLVRYAANEFVQNRTKRDYVVSQLVARGIPESTARIATEYAVKLAKNLSN